MPNYIITTKANFKPFSYAELLAPVASATKAHRELEDAYSDLGSEASVWEKLANSEPDKDVYNVYKNYSNDLQAQADKLAKEGLTPTSRRDLLTMKRRYSSDIKPIEEAWTKREADIKDYKTQLTKDPTLLSGDNNPMNASLTSYMNGNTPTYKYLSGDDLYKQGLTAATALSKGKYKESKPVLDAGRQYWKMVTEQGYSPDEAAKWLANNGAFPEITAEVNRIKEAYNTAGLGSNSAAADSQIIRGIMDGLHAGYKKDVDRQINRSLNNNPSDKNNYLQDTMGRRFLKLGTKLYQVDDKNALVIDEKGNPVIFEDKSDSKPKEENSSNRDFSPITNASNYINDKQKEAGLATLLQYGRHFGNYITTVDNAIFGHGKDVSKSYYDNENITRVGNALSPVANRRNIKIESSDDILPSNYHILKSEARQSVLEKKDSAGKALVELANGKYKINKNNILGKMLTELGYSPKKDSTFFEFSYADYEKNVLNNPLIQILNVNTNREDMEGTMRKDLAFILIDSSKLPYLSQ